MNQGVEILLARMDSHPEEFIDDVRGEWRWLTNQLEGPAVGGLYFLTDEEKIALHEKYSSLVREQFTKNIMQQLLKDKDEGKEGTIHSSRGVGIGTTSSYSNTHTSGGVAYGGMLNSQLNKLTISAPKISFTEEETPPESFWTKVLGARRSR